jgi:hypothetical protein
MYDTESVIDVLSSLRMTIGWVEQFFLDYSSKIAADETDWKENLAYCKRLYALEEPRTGTANDQP